MGNERIYSSFNRGEFGGKLNEINLATGSSLTVFSSAFYPVTDVKFAPDGQVWFVAGVSHMMLEDAGLFSYHEQHIQCHAKVSGFPTAALNALRKPNAKQYLERTNWPFEPTTFVGLNFAEDGSILVASDDYGILTYRDEKWSKVTENWPQAVSLAGFVLLKNSVAVLPVYDRGVVIIDLKTSQYKFILPDYCKSK